MAQQDIFRNAVGKFGGAFASDLVRLVFSNMGTASTANLLTPAISLSYSQSVSRLYEVGSRDVFYIGGRVEGSASMSHVVGPASLVTQFFQTFGDVCQAASNTILFAAVNRCGGGAGSQINFTAKFCVLVNTALGVQADRMVVGLSNTLMFSALEYSDGATAPVAVV